MLFDGYMDREIRIFKDVPESEKTAQHKAGVQYFF
jgi:hypothetical protein